MAVVASVGVAVAGVGAGTGELLTGVTGLALLANDWANAEGVVPIYLIAPPELFFGFTEVVGYISASAAVRSPSIPVGEPAGCPGLFQLSRKRGATDERNGALNAAWRRFTFFVPKPGQLSSSCSVARSKPAKLYSKRKAKQKEQRKKNKHHALPATKEQRS